MREAMVKLYFEKAGLLTTIQDLGRPNYQAFGIPKSGVMDKFAYKMANRLVDNPAGSPVLEITYLAPKIEIIGSCQMALTGANLSPKHNGKDASMYETITIKNQAKLSFGKVQNGCRAYLAIRGNWLVDKYLGSYSTLVNSVLSQKIQKGDELLIQPLSKIPKRIFPKKLRPKYPNEVVIRVLPAPEFELFNHYAIGFFFSQAYTVTTDSNRTGYRLQEKIPDFTTQQEIISSGIIAGTIQITHSGQAIVLLADAQTTGGYPRIAQVITADLDKFAQLKPHDKIRFQLISLEEAYQVLK